MLANQIPIFFPIFSVSFWNIPSMLKYKRANKQFWISDARAISTGLRCFTISSIAFAITSLPTFNFFREIEKVAFRSVFSHLPECRHAISRTCVIHSSIVAHEQDGSVKFDSGLPCSIIRWNATDRSSQFAGQKWNIDRSGSIIHGAPSEYRSGRSVSLLTQLITGWPRSKCKFCHRSKWNGSMITPAGWASSIRRWKKSPSRAYSSTYLKQKWKSMIRCINRDEGSFTRVF